MDKLFIAILNNALVASWIILAYVWIIGVAVICIYAVRLSKSIVFLLVVKKHH